MFELKRQTLAELRPQQPKLKEASSPEPQRFGKVEQAPVGRWIKIAGIEVFEYSCCTGEHFFQDQESAAACCTGKTPAEDKFFLRGA